MPKRTDISTILIIGAGPIIIGQACEFDYSGTQACKALRAEGYRIVLINSNPATIMTDPDMADRTYIEPITPEIVEKIIAKERHAIPGGFALLPTMGGQTALNCALSLRKMGVLEKYDVEMIGATAEAIDKAEDRELFREAMTKIGLKTPRSHQVKTLSQALTAVADIGLPAIIRPSFTMGGTGGRHRLHAKRIDRDRRARHRRFADRRGPDRGERARLERVRDGGGARQKGQLHHHLLDRKHRSDGRAHRRFDHRRSGADADRQGIPDHARRLDRGLARDRGRDRRLERAVRGQSGRRAHGGDRNEPARLALVGAGLEGDRVSDRQGRGQARRRLHARRDRQRHHRRRDAGVVRADDRLYRHQDPALRVREVSGRRADADDGDEVGRRSDGDRPHLPGIAAEGAALARDRPRRARRDRNRRTGPRRRPQRAARRDRPADARSPAQSGAGDALGDGRRGDPRMQQDRPLVPGADRRDRRARREGARSRSAARCGQYASLEGERLLGRAPCGACRQGRSRRRRRSQAPRRSAGVQAHRHLRRRVRFPHGLHVFDL